MASPSVECNGGGSTSGDTTTRSLPTPFLIKTYHLVDDKTIDDVISWNGDGSTFVVWNTTEFAKDLLPKYFKHNNFSSFVRQLNTYGFRKVVPDRWEFSNDCFRRGEKRMLCDIQRRKIASAASASAPTRAATPAAAAAAFPSPSRRTDSLTGSNEEQVLSSNSSRGPTTANLSRETLTRGGTNEELIGENERLMRENVQLNKELSQMKKICKNIYGMMSNYATEKPSEVSSSQQPATTVASTMKPLDLLPLKRLSEECVVTGDDGNQRQAAGPEEDISLRPKLFGVQIGVKRGKKGHESERAEFYNELQLKQPGVDVKLEPLDQNRDDGNGVDNKEHTWVMKQCQPYDRKPFY